MGIVRQLVQRSTTERRLLGFVFLATMSVVILSGAVEIVRADVPNILQIENISQDSMGRIRIQIRHLNPSGSHYVDVIEVDVEGQVKSFPGPSTQYNNPFTVELELGQIQGKPKVKARAHCTTHGWGSWSDEIQVPEFSQIHTAVLVVLAVTLLVTRRRPRIQR